jgi:hypothetical protein
MKKRVRHEDGGRGRCEERLKYTERRKEKEHVDGTEEIGEKEDGEGRRRKEQGENEWR